jgi:hypothetical protein
MIKETVFIISHSILVCFGHMMALYDQKTHGNTGRDLYRYGYRSSVRYTGVYLCYTLVLIQGHSLSKAPSGEEQQLGGLIIVHAPVIIPTPPKQWQLPASHPQLQAHRRKLYHQNPTPSPNPNRAPPLLSYHASQRSMTFP